MMLRRSPPPPSGIGQDPAGQRALPAEPVQEPGPVPGVSSSAGPGSDAAAHASGSPGACGRRPGPENRRNVMTHQHRRLPHDFTPETSAAPDLSLLLGGQPWTDSPNGDEPSQPIPAIATAPTRKGARTRGSIHSRAGSQSGVPTGSRCSNGPNEATPDRAGGRVPSAPPAPRVPAGQAARARDPNESRLRPA